jgi:hypothetical protein
MFKVLVSRFVARLWQTRQMLRGIGCFMRNYIYIKNEVGKIRDVQSILFRCVARRWQTRQMLRGIGRFMRKWSGPAAPFRYEDLVPHFDCRWSTLPRNALPAIPFNCYRYFIAR